MKSNNHILKDQAPLGYLIHEVARLMKRKFEVEARVHDVTLPQWRALATIATREGITQVALAAHIDADPMTISGVLDRLEKRGLIERYSDPSDGRAKLARVTEQGMELFVSARQVGLAMYETALVGVPAADRDTVVRVLGRMRDNLSGHMAELEEAEA